MGNTKKGGGGAEQIGERTDLYQDDPDAPVPGRRSGEGENICQRGRKKSRDSRRRGGRTDQKRLTSCRRAIGVKTCHTALEKRTKTEIRSELGGRKLKEGDAMTHHFGANSSLEGSHTRYSGLISLI